MKARSTQPRTIGLGATAGGVLWLMAFGSVFLYPLVGNIGHLPVAFVGMAAAGVLLAFAVAALYAEVTTSGAHRAVVYLALTTAIVATCFALVLLGFTGDERLALGIFDPEWVSWQGYAAFMAAMAVASVRASAPVVSAAWWAAILGAAGQAVVFIVYSVWPPALGTIQLITSLMPIPILSFGIGWCAIGLGRLKPETVAPGPAAAGAATTG